MKRQSQVLLVLVFISFLGLGVAGLGTNYFKLKPELQPLSVSISTDKDYYRPGQTIDIDVRVVDPATREPIKDVYVEIWIMPCEDCFDVSPIGVLKGRTDENGGASFQYRIKECEACGDTYTLQAHAMRTVKEELHEVGTGSLKIKILRDQEGMLTLFHNDIINESIEVKLEAQVLSGNLIQFDVQATPSQALRSLNISLDLPSNLNLMEGAEQLTFNDVQKKELKRVRVTAAPLIQNGSFRVVAMAKGENDVSSGNHFGYDLVYVTIANGNISISRNPPPELMELKLVNFEAELNQTERLSGLESLAGTITVEAGFYFVDREEGITYPQRRSWAELYDSDLGGAVLTLLKDIYGNPCQGWTDNNGHIIFGPIENYDGAVEDGYDIFVRIYARTPAGYVHDGSYNPYRGQTVQTDNVADGYHDLGDWYADPNTDNNSWALNMLISELKGYEWVDNRPNTDPPGFGVLIRWYWGATWGTGYSPSLNEIQIAGSSSNPHHRYDGVTLHEYGHAIAQQTWTTKLCDFDDSPGGGHDWCDDPQDVRLAWSEGWAHFFASAVLNSPTAINAIVNGRWMSINVETGATVTTVTCNANAYGDDNEVSIAGIQWDLWDSSQDDQNGDGIGDSVSNYNLWEVLRANCGIYTVQDFWNRIPHTWEFWSTFYEHGINEDTTPPSNPTNLWSPSHSTGVWSSDDTVEVQWSGASDDLSGVHGYSRVWDTNPSTIPPNTVDPNYFQTGTYCISFHLSTGNSWYFHVRTRDNAGNWNPGARHIGPFYIDTAAPNTPSLSESHCGSSWTLHNSPYFTWNNPGDTGSGVSYYQASINDGALFTVSSPYHPTWSDGTYGFKVRAVDGAGNPGYWSNVITVKIDATAPTGSIIINTGATYTTSTSVTLTLSAVDGSGSGVAFMCFSNDGSSWSSWESYTTSKSWMLTSGDGTKTVYVKYKDNVGLESSPPASDTIILDTLPPSTVTLSSPPSGTATSESKPTFTWNPSTDGTSGIACYTFQIDTSTAFNSGNLRTISGIATTSYTPDTPLSGGTWYWHVKALDNAGNPGSYSTYWSLTITIPDFQLWIDPSSHTVRPGGSTTYTVYVKSVYGFSGTVSLDKSTDPAEPTIMLMLDASVTLGAGETKSLTLSVSTSSSTPEKSYTVTVTGASADLSHSASALLVVSSFGISSALDIVMSVEYNVYFIYPDYGGVKPPGVSPAWLSDWTATGFMIGMCSNPQYEVTDTNPTVIDTSSGMVKLRDRTVVLFGGPLVNAPVHYYEANRVAPLYFQNDGGVWYWYRADGTRLEETGLTPDQMKSGQNMFVVEAFIDNSGNRVFIVYGYGWKGTFAAGLFFKSVIYPDISSYSNSWYVYRWNDSNKDGFVDLSEIVSTPVVQG